MATQWDWASPAPHITRLPQPRCVPPRPPSPPPPLGCSLQRAVAPTWQDMGFIREDSSEDMRHSFIFSFLPLQLLILHSYLLGTSVVCLLAGKLKKKKRGERASEGVREREREALQPSCMQWAFTALLISFKIVFSENRKNVGFNISHSPLHLDRRLLGNTLRGSV